jgi:hypothetical protein
MPDHVDPSDGEVSEPQREYAAFLAYNSQDEAAPKCARWIWEALEANDHPTWFADWDVPVGTKSISAAMERGIAESACCFVLLGESELGNWEGNFELELALKRSAENKKFRVLAVLLPGSSGPGGLRDALQISGRVELQEQFTDEGLTEEGLKRILCAVRAQTRRQFEEELARAAASPPTRAAAQAEVGAYRALLVGISHYEDAGLGTLKGPPNDLVNLAGALAEIGAPGGGDWEVARSPEPGGTEPEREELGRRLRDFFLKAGEEDTLLFYYSGHGTIAEDDSYLCTGKTNAKDPEYESIAASEIALWVKRSPARAVVVVLDCCRAATLNASAYHELGDNVAVILASQGNTSDAESDTDPSPFTETLIGVLRDPSVSSREDLTVGDLVVALEHRGVKPVTNARLGTDIVLARRPAEPVVHVPVEAAPVISVGVRSECIDLERLPLVRQLAATLDGLLAGEHEPDQVPSALVTETMQTLARELRASLALRERQSLEQALRDESLPTCAVRFADKADGLRLGDLPWEYLALHVDPQPGEQDPQDVLRSPPMFVERHLEVSPAPKAGGVTVQKVDLFSSLRSTEVGKPHPLTVATKEQLEKRLHIKMAPAAASSWNVFSMAQDDADVVILQCPVRLEGERLEMLFARESGDMEPVPAHTVVRKLKDRTSMTVLLIETIADDSGDQPALGVRRLARGLAENLRCPVVAICHPRAYAHCLKDYPNEPVFLAALLQAVRSRLDLDQAAYSARNEVVTNLPTEPTIVGIPIVMKPEPPEERLTRRDDSGAARKR